MLKLALSPMILGGALLGAGCGASSSSAPNEPESIGVPARGGSARDSAAGDDARPAPAATAAGSARDPAGKAASPPGPRLGPLAHLWTAETKDWNGALLLTKDGDLLSFAGRGIRVHARDDGRVLHAASACAPVSEDAVAWAGGDTRFLVVCSDELRSFSWPKLGSERVVRFAARVDKAAIGGGVVAVAEDGFSAADKKGMLRVLDAKDGRVVDVWLPPAEVQSLAVSPDGGRVVVATDDEVFLRDVRAKTTTSLRKARLAKGFAFSPDGRSLFGRFESFTASVVDPASGTLRAQSSWQVGSWITAARWVGEGQVAATGSDGLALYEAKATAAPSPIDDLGEGLAVSADGGLVCAGGRGGRIACFGKTKPAPTTIAGAFPRAPAGQEPGAAPAAAAEVPTIDGKIVTKQGKKLVVQVDPGQAIEVGATGEVSKPFSQNIGFGVMSGWLVIAEVRVAAVDKGKVTLDLVTEKSAMTVNGRPANHFAPGEVRLSLSPPP